MRTRTSKDKETREKNSRLKRKTDRQTDMRAYTHKKLKDIEKRIERGRDI